MMNKILLVLILLLSISFNLTYAFDINGVTLDMDKESALNTLLNHEYALTAQVVKDGRLNMNFKGKSDSILVELKDNNIISVTRFINGSTSEYTARVEDIKSKYNTKTYVDKDKISTFVFIDENTLFILGLNTDNQKMIDILTRKNKSE